MSGSKESNVETGDKPKNILENKIVLIGLLILLTLIPLGMINGVISERADLSVNVAKEVSESWGGKQDLTGPVIVAPYRVYFTNKNGEKRSRIENAYFLPDSLSIRGTADPEIRNRGIYQVAVYKVKLLVSGEFNSPDFSKLKIDEKDLLKDEIHLAFGVPDTRSLDGELLISWDGKEIPFLPSVKGCKLFKQGIHAPLPTPEGGSRKIGFSFSIDLNGSEDLFFRPMGKTTTVTLASPWPDPSFQGNFLPVKRTVSDDGFTARWDVSFFGRSYPQKWKASEHSIGKSRFGVRLVIPVDFYTKIKRTTKYGILFIALTFIAFFIFEITNRYQIHPVQYLMIGFALSLFYLMLISISEHIGFWKAYMIATLANVGMITLYSRSILKKSRQVYMISCILLFLYGFLYTLMSLQDFALLFGSAGLFVFLSVVMYITRNIDWYERRGHTHSR